MTAPPTPPTRPSPFAAFAHPGFRAYIATRFLVTMSVQMLSAVVGFHVYALTHSARDLGYLGLAQFLPVMLFSILAGQVADKVDRRAVLLACDLAFIASGVALTLIARSPHPSVDAIFAVFALIGVARAFYGPSGSSLLPSLVPTEDFTNAIAWQSTLWQAAAIGGPSLGGLAYGRAGSPEPVYLGTTIGFALAGLLLVWIPRVESRAGAREPATLATALAGVRYVAKNRILLGAITLDFFAVFLGGATALLPVYATDILHRDAASLGLMRASPAIGAALTAAILAFRPLGRHTGRKMFVGVALFGAATLVFGLSRSYPLTLGALVVLGAADMVSAVVRGTLIQSATPPELRGRVSAVNMMFIGASNELGEFESGTLASWIGAVGSVVFGGVGTLAVVAIWAWRFPAIRNVDRLEQVRPPEPAEPSAASITPSEP